MCSKLLSLFILLFLRSVVALHYFQIAHLVPASYGEEENNEGFSIESQESAQDLDSCFLFISKRFFQRIPDEYTKDFLLKNLKLSEPVEMTMKDLRHHHRLEEGT
jgi:hypothetical protein